MRHVLALIAIIFAFASVAGTTTAHAHRYVSTPIVVLNHVDENNRSIPVIVEVQRGEIDLGSGIMLPCGAHHGIPVDVLQLAACGADGLPSHAVASPLPIWTGESLLRPPRTA